MKRTLPRHPLAIVGAIVSTASAVVFITLVIAMLAGMLNNPYAGLVVFIGIPAILVMGLLLIPAGIWLERRKLLDDPAAVSDWPVIDFRRAEVRRTALLLTALTAVNVIIVLLAGYGGLHAMETPSFCGQACHTPMHPQFQAWQGAPHSGVACVQCHIGDGAAAVVHAKLNGVRQLALVATGSYPRPIPPGAHMPPGAQAETCKTCHQPGRIIGDRVRVIREYADDEANTETMTVLQMHMSVTKSSARAIHWHADPSIRVEYEAADAERQTIPYVRVTDAKGQVKEYVATDAKDGASRGAERRTMDCIDCHNTVGHPISPTPEQAVDRAIAAAMVSHELPFARRESIRLVKASYPSQEAGVSAIETGLRDFYRSQTGSIDQQALAKTVGAVQELYRRNIFPAMKVTWGSYPDNRGHITSTGCFRCHDDSHEAKDGSKISGDCEYCHKQIEQPSPDKP
jgi:nitrate/TMAO reductase-like tetraheme cytochrome c subunit